MQVTLQGQRLFMAPFLEGDHRVTLHATTNLQYTLKTFCVVNLSIENGCKISVGYKLLEYINLNLASIFSSISFLIHILR